MSNLANRASWHTTLDGDTYWIKLSKTPAGFTVWAKARVDVRHKKYCELTLLENNKALRRRYDEMWKEPEGEEVDVHG